MKLMAFLGVALTFTLPAKAIWIYGTLDCPPYSSEVAVSASTALDFWDIYWWGLHATSAIVQVQGPPGTEQDFGDGWEFTPAFAATSISSPVAGTYHYFSWHLAGGWYALGPANCEVEGSNDPTPVISLITPDTWNAGTGPAVQIQGSGFGNNVPWNVNDHLSITGGISASVTSWTDSSISAIMNVPSNAPTQMVYVSVTSTGYNGMGFQQNPGGQGPTTTQTAQVLAAPPAQLSCPNQVTRGATATCTLSGVNAGNVTGWQFLGTDGVTVTGPNGVLSWGGTMVQGGAVRVTLAGGGTLEVNVSITSRGWSSQPASPQQVANGTLGVTLLTPPGPQLGYAALMGYSEARIETSVPTVQSIGGGPNNGYVYYPSAEHPSSTYWYRYIINPDLANPNSEFSIRQCGSNGWISHSDLLSQTHRHEYASASQSHWGYYSDGTNSQNILAYIETRVAPPGTSFEAFNSTTESGVGSRLQQILSAMAVEPYPVNFSESGQFLGNVNIGPNYANCN